MRRLVLLAAVLPALSGCLGEDEEPQPAGEPPPTAGTPAPAPADVRVSADLGAAPRRGPSLSGFLHGLGPGAPPDSLVRPLRPRLWRSVPRMAPYDRATALGARYQVVLSDLWGYPAGGWHGRRPPWRDLRGWERVVRGAARSLRGEEVEWDVWNEPDNLEFWDGTREQFFRVYGTAARALADELGDEVVVGGPSTTKARPEWLGGLLRHCRRNRCRVSFLSFHANLQPGEPIPALAGRLRRVRAAFLVRYRDVGLERVEVNESVGPADQYRPGEILGFLHHMEAGGADAAARSCWPDAAGSDNCTNGTLEGLVTPAHVPRSAWWAYRAYADGAEARVPSRTDSAAVAALASVRTGAAQVLLARHDRAAPGARPLEVELALVGLEAAFPGAERVLVSAALLPDSGEAPLPEPQALPRQEAAVGPGPVSVRVGALRPHEALIVKVTAG